MNDCGEKLGLRHEQTAGAGDGPGKTNRTRSNGVLLSGYVRKKDAADYMGITTRTLTEWMRRRIVPFRKISHKVCLFRISELDKAMDRYRTNAVAEDEE